MNSRFSELLIQKQPYKCVIGSHAQKIHISVGIFLIVNPECFPWNVLTQDSILANERLQNEIGGRQLLRDLQRGGPRIVCNAAIKSHTLDKSGKGGGKAGMAIETCPRQL